MTGEIVDLGAFALEYSLAGDPGKPVVAFVHGLAADMRQFTEQQVFFQDDYRVLRMSLRGHGGSTSPERAGREDFRLTVMMRDLVQLLDRLDIAYDRLCRMAGRAGSKKPEAQQRIIDMMIAAAPPAIKYAQMNIGNYSYLDVIASAKVPLLLIRGEHDGAINRALTSTLAAFQSTTDGHVVDVAGAGHYVNLDEPEEFNTVLKDWFDRVCGSTTVASRSGKERVS